MNAPFTLDIAGDFPVDGLAINAEKIHTPYSKFIKLNKESFS